MLRVSVDSRQVDWNIRDGRVLYVLDALDQVIVVVRIELQGGRVNFQIFIIGIVLFEPQKSSEDLVPISSDRDRLPRSHYGNNWQLIGERRELEQAMSKLRQVIVEGDAVTLHEHAAARDTVDPHNHC